MIPKRKIKRRKLSTREKMHNQKIKQSYNEWVEHRGVSKKAKELVKKWEAAGEVADWLM